MRIFPKGEVLPQCITWVLNNQQSGTNNSPHCQEAWFSDNLLFTLNLMKKKDIKILNNECVLSQLP